MSRKNELFIAVTVIKINTFNYHKKNYGCSSIFINNALIYKRALNKTVLFDKEAEVFPC